jgi:Right handed beta helix region
MVVQQVGFLRLYNVLIENFGIDGIVFDADGNLAVYDSKITDSALIGLFLGNPTAKAYVHNTAFDNDATAGVLVSGGGTMTIADSSAHFDGIGFWADSGTIVLDNDSVILNTAGMEVDGSGQLYFAGCLISDNTTAWNVAAGGTMTDTSPGTSLITPGQATSGTLSTATVLQ